MELEVGFLIIGFYRFSVSGRVKVGFRESRCFAFYGFRLFLFGLVVYLRFKFSFVNIWEKISKLFSFFGCRVIRFFFRSIVCEGRGRFSVGILEIFVSCLGFCCFAVRRDFILVYFLR